MQKKYKNTFWFLFKSALAVLTLLYIFYKIKGFDLSDFYVPNCNPAACFLFLLVFLLMPLNWFVESIKWKYLIRKLELVSTVKAFKAVISGIAFALISPARSGEIPGRIFILKKENRGKALFSTATGSLSQMLITLTVGLTAGIFFMFFFSEKLNRFSSGQLFYLKTLSVLSAVLGFLFLFNLKHFVRLLKKIMPDFKFLKYVEILSEYKRFELFRVLIYSFIRYVIFSFQYLLLLNFFDTDIFWYEAFTGIALTYLLSSLIPVLSIFEIGVRGMAAILFLGMFSNNTPGILSATVMLWLINLALPAIVGSVIFYKTKI